MQSKCRLRYRGHIRLRKKCVLFRHNSFAPLVFRDTYNHLRQNQSNRLRQYLVFFLLRPHLFFPAWSDSLHWWGSSHLLNHRKRMSLLKDKLFTDKQHMVRLKAEICSLKHRLYGSVLNFILSEYINCKRFFL